MTGLLHKVLSRICLWRRMLFKNVPTREQMENIALIIPTKPARKAGGFAGVGFSGDKETDEMEGNELVSMTE